MLTAPFLAMVPYALIMYASPILGAPAMARHRGLQPRCGPVQQFYDPKMVDWNTNGLNEWLDGWWNNHTADIQSNSNGFAGAFGEYVTISSTTFRSCVSSSWSLSLRSFYNKELRSLSVFHPAPLIWNSRKKLLTRSLKMGSWRSRLVLS